MIKRNNQPVRFISEEELRKEMEEFHYDVVDIFSTMNKFLNFWARETISIKEVKNITKK